MVHDGKVIVNPGAQGGRETSYAVAAYDANDGKILWKSGHAQASYASPMLATLAGRLQVLIFDAEGLAGLDLSNGQEWWRFPWKTAFDINASQPIVVDEGNVFITSQNGAALINVSEQEGKFVAKSLWENRLMKCHYANPIAKGGYVYGLDGGILACLDLKTGKRQWKGGRYGHGQMLLAGNSLLILTEQGDVAVVEASRKEHQESAKFPAIEGKTWNNPVLCRGTLYVRNHLEMAAFDLRKNHDNER
ncbi:MAG: PQQ-binding-like beta-propeller repeat protein [Planctomycetota bacterium]